MKYKHIIWDWNGTLLDDVDVAIKADNDILEEYGMEPITRDKYFEAIQVPIIKFYEKIFDLNKISFDVISAKFMDNYKKYLDEAKIMEGAVSALKKFGTIGIDQMIISSFEHVRLHDFVERFKIKDYFSVISGAEDMNSGSKIDRAKKVVEAAGAKSEEILVIGDMIHDKEMADALGADCLLVAKGHQNKRDLEESGAIVCDSLEEGLNRFFVSKCVVC